MIRRFFFALFFGTLIALAAMGLGITGSSHVQTAGIGILSALGFLVATLMARGRLRRSQGEVPVLKDKETVLLYGPGELTDAGGSSPAWFYVSNQRLMLRGGVGEALDLPLADIEELRPPISGLFSGQVLLVAKGQGLLKLKVPDAARWHAAISRAIHR